MKRNLHTLSAGLCAIFAATLLAPTAFAGRYWCGASEGNWSDTANWSSSDGGASGASVPDSSTSTLYFTKLGTLVFDAAGDIGDNDVKIYTASSTPVVWKATEPNYGLTSTKGLRLAALDAGNSEAALKIESGTYSFKFIYIPRNGANNTGTLTIDGGSVSATGDSYIGYKGGKGTLILNAGTFTLNGSQMFVGNKDSSDSGEGEIIVNGGDFIVHRDVFYLGETAKGVFTLNGGNVTLDDSSYGLTICHGKGDATAELNLNGGVLTTPKLRVDKISSTESATVHFNGATLKPTRTTTSFFDAKEQISATLGEKGLVVDTAGFNVTIAHPLALADGVGSTKLVKKGSGTLTITGATPFTAENIIVYGGTAVVGGTTYEVNAESAIDASAGGDLGTVVIHGEKLEGWLKDPDFTTYASKYGATGGAYLEQPVPVVVDVNGTRKSYINLETGKTYIDTIDGVEFSFTTEALAPRTLKVVSPVDGDPVENVRDVGSWPLVSVDGTAKMNQGVIYRGGHLDHFIGATAEQQAAGPLAALKTEIDLRIPGLDSVGCAELNDGDASPVAAGCKYYRNGLGWGDNTGTQIGADDNGNFTNQIRRTFSRLGSADALPAYFHCRIGTDRTGIVGLLLLAMMGVEEEVLYRDYLMSNFANIGGSRDLAVPETFVSYLLRGDCNSGKYVYTSKDGEYGESIASRARQYLEMCGVTAEELGNITAALSGETPAQVLARVNAYETARGVRTVSYVPYEGSTATNATHRLPAGTNILPRSTPSRDGYKFKGWDTAGESDGIVYAIWEEVADQPQTVKWDNNGGDNRLANGENWYYEASGEKIHTAPRVIDSVESDGKYAALNKDESFTAKSVYLGRGSDNPATIDITNGTVAVAGTVNLGRYGQTAELNIFDGKFSASNIYVGNWGSHVYNKLNIHGGEITLTGNTGWPNDSITIGMQTESCGDVLIDGGTINATGTFHVGFAGYASNMFGGASTFTMRGGTLNVTGDMKVSDQEAHAVGKVSIEEGTLGLTGGLNIANTSNSWAQVDISGGDVTVGGTIRIGNHTYAQHAVLNVCGGNLDAKEISVARQCNGTLSITDDGVVTAEQIQKAQDAPAAATPRIFIDGGKIVAKKSTGLFFASVDQVVVGDKGWTFDTAGNDVTIEACYGMSGTGPLVKEGEGTLYIKADSYGIHCDYNIRGMITVKAGTLRLPANETIYCAGTDVAEGATLDLNGSTIIVVTKKVTDSVWTNAAGDANAANAANWNATVKYFDVNGNEIDALTGVVSGVLPTADSDVVIPAALDYPKGFDESSVRSVFLSTSSDISLIVRSGATYSDYSGGSFLVSGNVKLFNNFNGLLNSAVAWYDPSDTSTLTVSDDGIVAKVANKGYLGAAMDAVMRSSDPLDGPMLSTDDEEGCQFAQYKQNGLDMLVFTNRHGFVSAGTLPTIANGQSRALFVVSSRESLGDNTSTSPETMSLEIGPNSNDQTGLVAVHQLPWGDWADEMLVHAVTNGVSQESYNVGNLYGNNAGLVNVWTFNAKAKSATATRRHYSASEEKFSTESKTKEYEEIIGGSGHRVLYGNRGLWGSGSQGRIGEALAFVSDLDNTAAAAVEGYLSAKWLGDESVAPDVAPTTLDALALVDGASVDCDGAEVSFGVLFGNGTVSNAGSVTVTGEFDVNFTDGAADGVVAIASDAIDLSRATFKATGAASVSHKDRIVVMRFTPGAEFARFAAEDFDDGGWMLFYDTAKGEISVGRKPGFAIILR